MLTGLSIHNVVLIDQLNLEPLSGFTALTGETGAGKSILLDALSLALGHKADLGFIRANTDQATVVATFSLSAFPKEHPLKDLLNEHDLLDDDDELLLKRTLHRTQKGKAFVNDQPISTALLKQIGDFLLHVHGQHDHLLNETLHKTLLDDFANNTRPAFNEALCTLKNTYKAWLDAEQAYLDFEQTLITQKERESFYVEVRRDLEGLTLAHGNEERLIEERHGLQQLGKIITTVEQTLKGLDTPTSWINTLYSFQKNLERCDGVSLKPLQNAIQALSRAGIELTEAQTELKNLFDADRAAAADLEAIDEQLHLLRSFARKYKTTTDGLCDLLAEAKQATLDEGDIILQKRALENALTAAKQAYDAVESIVFDHRLQAAKALTDTVMEQLPDLKLDRAVFDVRIQKASKPSSDGGHTAAFWVSMNQGQDLAPLAKTASGGEMARLMLVLKMIVARTTMMPTLIFDEIDTGVGGAVASAIGRKLRELGSHVQVLSITHSPQVAALAHHHWRIIKTEENKATRTSVTPLTSDARINEIARMLAGDILTDEARQAAIRLMN